MNDKEILEQEEQLTLATRSLDLEALDRLYADDILFTGVTGALCDKSSLMDEARRGAAHRQAAAGAPQIKVTYEKDDLKAVKLGDAAITNYRFVVTVNNNGQETKNGYRTTNVWARRQRGWQVVAGHTSSVAG